MSAFSSKKEINTKEERKDPDVVKLLAEAYLYGYPIMTMDYTHRFSTNVESPNGKGKAPYNQWANLSKFPKAGFTAVVRPNLDTYYSLICADLSKEPLYIHIPATKRYYLIPILNAFGDVVNSLGSRTTGQKALEIALVGPNYKGDIPSDLTVIRSQTSLNWLVGRVAVKNNEDGVSEVKNFQKKLICKPLSERNNPNYVQPKGIVNPKNNYSPSEKVDGLDIVTYFNEMMALMVDNPPTAADKPLMEKLKSVGIVPGGTFDLSKFSAVERFKIKKIPGVIQKKFAQKTAKPDPSLLQNGWQVNTKGLGEYGTNYVMRAYVTKIGYGANTAEDAIYPNSAVDSDGNLYDGGNKYVLHFNKEDLPPVKGFWSITMYNTDGFLVENSINRYCLGSMKNLKYNKDGSLDIYIQSNPPKGNESNWLPSTQKGEKFELTFRLYWPEKQVLDRVWQMPGVKKVN